MTLQEISLGTLHYWLALILPTQRIFVLYLLSAGLLAFVSYVYFRRRLPAMAGDRPDIKRNFWEFLLPKEVYLHPSAKQDYLFFLANGLIFGGFIAQALVGVGVFADITRYGILQVWERGEGSFSWSSSQIMLLYTLVSLVLIDFSIFITHYLQHRVPLLWKFHQVHHSAEVLTPVTLYRMHPVDLFFTMLVGNLLAGVAFGVLTVLAGAEPGVYEIWHVNVGFFLFYLLGYNLRHTHVWLSYPAWLSHIMISPAQHQIHHSINPRHRDKNFGLMLACWDWICGSLYVPSSYESLEYGISREERNPFHSVTEMFCLPFVQAVQYLRTTRLVVAKALLIVATILVLGFDLWYYHGAAVRAAGFSLPSVYIEELTWTEVDQALKGGYRSVIIPTGGTEQNGPHVVLGKHNYLVRQTAGEIAKRVGRTLVAPVLSYVPEGDPEPAVSGHMHWPGTISIPEDVFEQVLEAAALSFKTHGFTHIFFLGDSGGNQESQKRVARELEERWRGDGLLVAHISQYYENNGQMAWLKRQGFQETEIGFHAGMRDTSELLFVHPSGVRAHPLPAPPFFPSGVNGNPGLASAELGKTLIELKVQAGVRQIKHVLDSHPDGP